MIGAFQVKFSPGLHDFNPLMAGEGATIPGAAHAPASDASCILIHYILKGHGTVSVDGSQYPAKAGQIFILNTAKDVSYTSDAADPWFYRWVGFTGELSYQFESLPPVLDVEEDPFPSLKYLQDPSMPLDYLLAGDLFHLYCRFLRPKNRKQDPVHDIIEYIRKHYMENLAVEDFSKKYGLDRRYLSRLFKKKTGFTIRAYITEVRFSAAEHFLMQGYSGKEVAVMCGYSDTSNFYKSFKSRRGMNPSEWRKDQLSKTENYWKKG